MDEDYLTNDEYINAFEKGDLTILSDVLKSNLSEHLERINNSKSAWKKEARE